MSHPLTGYMAVKGATHMEREVPEWARTGVSAELPRREVLPQPAAKFTDCYRSPGEAVQQLP